MPMLSNVAWEHVPGEWVSRSNRIRRELQVPPIGAAGSSPWTSRADVKLCGVPRSARQRDLLDVCYFVHHGRVEGLVMNLTQSILRKPWATDSSRAIGTRTLWYSYDLDRVLPATEEATEEQIEEAD